MLVGLSQSLYLDIAASRYRVEFDSALFPNLPKFNMAFLMLRLHAQTMGVALLLF